MGDGYGKLLILLLAIGLLLLASSSKGKAIIGVLTQKIPESNPTDLTNTDPAKGDIHYSR